MVSGTDRPGRRREQRLAHLSEIFRGVQGEGPRAGTPQIFVRFAGCDLRCVWCDTPGSLERTADSIVRNRGEYDADDVEILPNPVGAAAIAERIDRLSDGTRWVSLTGGEPLLQAGFLEGFLPGLVDAGRRFYLETGGHRPAELERILPWVEVVAADLKLPGSAGERPLWEAHRRFLSIAVAREVFVKLVVGRGTPDDELACAAETIAEASPDLPTYLQPVTPVPGGPVRPTVAEIRRWVAILRARLAVVRVAPQWQLPKRPV